MLDRILVVDDEPIVLDILSEVLSREGFHVTKTNEAHSAVQLLSRDPHEIVLCDIRMPGMDGFDFLRHVHRAFPATDVVLMTGYATVDGAIDAMALGAADYLIKPLKPKEVVARIRSILARRRLESELHALQSELRSRYEIHNVVALSARSRAMVSALRRISDQDEPVILIGESGSGRRFIARTLHTTSKRRDQPMAVVNGGNPYHNDLRVELFGLSKNGRRIQRGQIDRSRAGSLHISDFELLPRELQIELVRCLRSRTYVAVDGDEPIALETRITISLANPVGESIERGALPRELSVLEDFVTINVPPLRLRLEDLPGLSTCFVEGYALESGQSLRIQPEALRVFSGYEFPGNVTELFAILAHAAKNSLDGALSVELVERSFRQAQTGRVAASPMSEQLDDREYQLVLRAVDRNPGRLDHAARELGISRTTLWRRMRKYGISLPAQRARIEAN